MGVSGGVVSGRVGGGKGGTGGGGGGGGGEKGEGGREEGKKGGGKGSGGGYSFSWKIGGKEAGERKGSGVSKINGKVSKGKENDNREMVTMAVESFNIKPKGHTALLNEDLSPQILDTEEKEGSRDNNVNGKIFQRKEPNNREIATSIADLSSIKPKQYMTSSNNDFSPQILGSIKVK